MDLYTYYRSTSSYRVRIALNLKGLHYETVPVHLVKDGGEQHSPEFHDVNPQELIPVLMHGGRLLRQSLAIMEYVEEKYPQPPLLPRSAEERARAAAAAAPAPSSGGATSAAAAAPSPRHSP